MSNAEITAVHQLIDQLARERFFGAVTVKFERGEVVLIQQQQNLKPCDISLRNNRGQHEQHNS
jgi:hypothetical protein